jgi:hypothetical protein
MITPMVVLANDHSLPVCIGCQVLLLALVMHLSHAVFEQCFSWCAASAA